MAQHKSTAVATIANGASLSSPISLGEKTLCGILVPPSWTAAGLSFQASDDGGVTWSNVFDSTGAEVTIASAGIVAGQRVSIDPKPFAGIDFVKIRSGTGAAPVNQGGARALTLISRKVYPLTWTGTAAATGGGPPVGPAFVAHAAAGSTDDVAVATPAVNTTGANFGILTVSSILSAPVPAVTDTYGNTWTPLTSRGATAMQVTMFYSSGMISGAGHVFQAGSGAATYPSICVLVFSGVTGTLDTQNGASNLTATGPTTFQPGSVTPASNGELIVTGMGVNQLSGLTIGSSFTTLDANPGDGAHNWGSSIAYLIQATVAAVNPTWSFTCPVSTSGATIIAAFK